MLWWCSLQIDSLLPVVVLAQLIQAVVDVCNPALLHPLHRNSTLCLKKTGPLQSIWHNFTSSQHSLISEPCCCYCYWACCIFVMLKVTKPHPTPSVIGAHLTNWQHDYLCDLCWSGWQPWGRRCPLVTVIPL